MDTHGIKTQQDIVHRERIQKEIDLIKENTTDLRIDFTDLAIETEMLKSNADDLSNHSNKRASLTEHGHVQQGVYSATLEDSGWQGTEAPFTQEITITGLLATDTPVIDVVMKGVFEEDKDLLKKWNKIYRIVTEDDKIIVYSTSDLDVSLPIQLKVVR